MSVSGVIKESDTVAPRFRKTEEGKSSCRHCANLVNATCGFSCRVHRATPIQDAWELNGFVLSMTCDDFWLGRYAYRREDNGFIEWVGLDVMKSQDAEGYITLPDGIRACRCTHFEAGA